jgi:hypothetical protein
VGGFGQAAAVMGEILNFLRCLCGSDLAHSSPHPFSGSPAAPSRLHSARVPLPDLLQPPLWCGSWQALFGYSCRPLSPSLHPGAPSRSAPPALVVWGLAGAFVVPLGCMGFRRSRGAKWMLCLLAAGGCKNIYQ